MRQSALLVIFLIVFLDFVGAGIILPILPYYVQSMGASAWHLGIALFAHSAMQLLFAPVWQRLSDYVGRRPILLLTLLGNSVALALLGVAGSIKWVIIARILSGIFSANFATAHAYVADIASPAERAKAQGIIRAGTGLGFIFGPAIGGLTSRYGFEIPMLVAAVFSLFNLLFAIIKLEEPAATGEERSHESTPLFDSSALRLAFEDPRSRISFLLFFLVTFAVVQMETVFALYMWARYQYDSESIGFTFAVIGVARIGMQTDTFNRFSTRYGDLRTIIFGSLACALAFFIFPSVSSPVFAILCLLLYAATHGAIRPSLSNLASAGAPVPLRGIVMKVFFNSGKMAAIVSAPIAGWLFDRMSWRSPFFTGAAFLLATATIALLWLVMPSKVKELAEAENNPYRRV